MDMDSWSKVKIVNVFLAILNVRLVSPKMPQDVTNAMMEPSYTQENVSRNAHPTTLLTIYTIYVLKNVQMDSTLNRERISQDIVNNVILFVLNVLDLNLINANHVKKVSL